jgi:xylulokinase
MTPTHPLLLGIDLGTSAAKAALLDMDGNLLAAAGKEYPIDTPRPGWAEQDPQTWYRAAAEAVRGVLAESGADPHRIAAASLAGQMHSLVCLGADGQPLRPAIIWADQRSRQQVKDLEEKIGRERLAELAGNPLAAGFMLASWQWLREHEPQVAASARQLMLPKDYLRYRMVGEAGSEPSDASSTLLFDPHKLEWSRPLLDAVGLSIQQLPPVFPSASVAGELMPQAADDFGLPAGLPVIFGGSDQALQALGQGMVQPGALSCTIGTGGQLFAPLMQPRHDPQLRLHLFCHVLPGRWHLQAAILSAGLALRWLRDRVRPGADYQELADEAAAVQAADEGLFFLPYLSGERTPLMDPDARAAFTGLGLSHHRAHLTRAVMEGVVFALRQGLDLMLETGAAAERLVASGGATRHPLWLQLQADIFNRPIYPARIPEVTARGAAMLAGLGIGIYGSLEETIRRGVVQSSDPVLPDPARADIYARAYERYCRLYPALRDR